MDYWGQQVAIVCELCGGWHDTHQCANFQSQQQPFSNTYQPETNNHPIFSWDNNQFGMQQSHLPSSPYQDQQYGAGPYDPSGMHQSYQPSYSFHNQQYGDWPYDPSKIQQQQGQQFQPQYAPWQEQFQPAEFQEQQFHTSYGQQSNEKSELEELRLIIESQAMSLKAMEGQFGQIVKALQAEQEAQEAEQRSRDVDSAVAFLLAQPRSIEVQQETSVGNSSQDQQMENTMQFPVEDEESFNVEMVDSMQSIELDQPLKSDPEEDPKLELKPLPDHMRYACLGESSTLPIIIMDANMSGNEEDKLLRIHCMHTVLLEDGSKLSVESPGRLYPISKEVVEEEIIKWPMFGVHSTSSTENSVIAELNEFRHQAYENSKLLKEQIRKWLDRQLAYKALHPP